ncbi:MAG: NUDIX domain-containing protein [Deltaproteobacteria bacterium]|nr:NUDIX domain-containing protein [Deltaproteobacteria bacterium]
MPISDYLKNLRLRIGSALVLMPSVTAVVFDEAGRVLLARHANGDVWGTPGGAVDPDEPPQDAVVREVWEELGLLVEPTRCLGTFGGPEFRITYANGDVVAYVITAYECRRTGGTLRPDGDEVLEGRWFRSDELATVALSRWARGVLPELVRRRAAWVPPVTWRPPER